MEIDLKKYPFLEDRDGAIPYPDPGDTFLDCIPKGWHDLFLKYCEHLNDAFVAVNVNSKALHFDQVKEKFGMLRIYWHIEYDCADPETVSDLTDACLTLIDELESDSAVTCSDCGEPATLHSAGWVLPYCRACAEKHNAAANERHKTSFTVDQTYSPL